MADTSLPEISPQVIPYLYYEDAGSAIEFLKTAFGFETVSAFRDGEGTVWTATLRTGNGLVMVGPGMDHFGTRAVTNPEFVSSMAFVFVDDVDAHYRRAVAADARVLEEPHTHFGGNRQYTVSDQGGQRWTFAQPMKESDTGDEGASN